jgi:hypothetical protein
MAKLRVHHISVSPDGTRVPSFVASPSVAHVRIGPQTAPVENGAVANSTGEELATAPHQM